MGGEQSSMSDSLLVPINLQAFLVGDTARDPVYDLAPVPQKEEELSAWYRDARYSFSIQADAHKSALAQGVHLHWALPAALTHSRHEAGKKPEQFCIPNRWLAVRMWHAAGSSEILSKAWVIESDYVSADPASGGVPFPFFGTSVPTELGGKHLGYVGRAVPLEDWKETHPGYRFALKSDGWGDPSFAAYYPACQGILGFHDKMDGVKKDDLVSYLVVGWYSDANEDPLYPFLPWQSSHAYASGDIVGPATPNGLQYRVTTAGTSGSSEPSWPASGTVTDGTVVLTENGADVFASLGWFCSNLSGVTAPRRTLCHGDVVDVRWQGLDQRYTAASSGSVKPVVAIGGSAAEAFSALLAPDKKPLQDVLCAFQHGQATQISERYQLGELLHRHSFGAVAGGKHWSLEAVDAPANTKSALSPVPENLQVLLSKLNDAQQALDRHARSLQSLRSRLFDCWATWASKQDPWADIPPPDRDSLDPVAKTVETAAKDLGTYEQAVEGCKTSVLKALTAEKFNLRLAESVMPPFLQAKDPFVVMRGDDLVGADRAHSQSADENAKGALRCRLAARDIVSGVRLQASVGRAWKAEDLQLDFPDVAQTPLPQEVARALALETLLFDPNCASLILKGNTNPSVLKLFKALQLSLAPSRESSEDNLKLTWDGQPPDPLGVTRCGEISPWLPVYMMWQVRWAPTYTPGQGSDSHSKALAGWQLSSEGDSEGNSLAGDLVLQAGSVQPGKEALLTGATIISALSGMQLAGNLKKFATASGLSGALEAVELTQALGQSLGGLNDLLLRQTLGLFLPPFDPETAQLDQPVWEAIGRAPQPLMPVAGTFLPLRAGALKFVNLWIVDSFGQTRRLIDSSTPLSPQPKVIASEALRPSATGYHAGFSPRLVQPARLNFAWQPADDAASGPICGWIVPNFLDKSLAVFSASGEPLGALESMLPALGEKSMKWVDDNTKLNVTFNWRAIPGSVLKVEEIGNQRLRRFIELVRNFTADEGQAFLELVDLVLRRTDGRIPAEDPAMGVLLGRPLALAHASLGLELYGLPAGYWTVDGAAWKFETEGFEKLRVPVRLGDMNLPPDGLVGYMAESDESCLFASEGATPRVKASRADNSRSLIQYGQELAVACDDQSAFVTLLMDASARVHAATGILPRHSVVLPQEATRLAGQIEEIFISVAPVLDERPEENASQPTMPRPSDAFGQWSWAIHPDLTGTVQTWHEIQPADDRARFADSPALTEGWLRLRLQQNQTDPNSGNETTGTER